MLRNRRGQVATVVLAGALLGYLGASGRLNSFARAFTGQLPARAESSSGATPACCDGVNKGQLLAQANQLAPGGGGAEPQPPTKTPPTQTPAADKRARNIIFVICDQ
jgi:hypothetical protein